MTDKAIYKQSIDDFETPLCLYDVVDTLVEFVINVIVEALVEVEGLFELETLVVSKVLVELETVFDAMVELDELES